MKIRYNSYLNRVGIVFLVKNIFLDKTLHTIYDNLIKGKEYRFELTKLYIDSRSTSL